MNDRTVPGRVTMITPREAAALSVGWLGFGVLLGIAVGALAFGG